MSAHLWTVTLAALLNAARIDAHAGVTQSNGANDAIQQYAQANLPHRNNTDGLEYLGFNWTGPAVDDGLWTLRLNTDDAWLPANLSASGAEKIVVTSYALQWSGSDVYKNLSSKIANDTDTLRQAKLIGNNTSPDFCVSFLGFNSDFDSSVTKQMNTASQDPCESLLGEACLSSLRSAFTSSFDASRSCSPVIPSSTLQGCENTWGKLNGGEWDSAMIVNGSQASNTSEESPQWDEPFVYFMQTHAASDNSTYEHERSRTQMLVLYETGKEAQILCTRFNQDATGTGAAARSASGVTGAVIAGLVVAALGHMMW